MAEVEFYYAIGSRYSYLAATQMPRLERETGCEVAWRPLSSARIFAARSSDPFRGDPVSGQYDWGYRERDAARWADLYGVPFVEPRGRVRFDPELLALACTAAERLGAVEPYSVALFAAMFDGSTDCIDEAECTQRSEACGLDARAFAEALHAPATAARAVEIVESALRAGVFGVPSFVIGDELFWGNDRLVLVEHHLRALGAG